MRLARTALVLRVHSRDQTLGARSPPHRSRNGFARDKFALAPAPDFVPALEPARTPAPSHRPNASHRNSRIGAPFDQIESSSRVHPWRCANRLLHQLPLSATRETVPKLQPVGSASHPVRAYFPLSSVRRFPPAAFRTPHVSLPRTSLTEDSAVSCPSRHLGATARFRPRPSTEPRRQSPVSSDQHRLRFRRNRKDSKPSPHLAGTAIHRSGRVASPTAAHR